MFSRFLDFDNDPFFSGHRERMNDFGRPLLSERFNTFQPLLGVENGSQSRPDRVDDVTQSTDRGMNSMMSNMMRWMDDPESFRVRERQPEQDVYGYSRSSVYSYHNAGDGKEPDVYEAHHSEMTAPGGLKEERKSMRDSKHDVEKTSVLRHINDRGHKVEMTRNIKTNENDKREEMFGINEGNLESFHNEWKERTSRYRQEPAAIQQGGKEKQGEEGKQAITHS